MARDQDTITAYHEAGHAIMAMSCGFRVNGLSIEPSDIGMGYVSWETPQNLTEHSRRCSVLVLASGMAADFIQWEKWGQGTPSDASLGHSDDRRQAYDHLRHLNESGHFDAYLALSLDFLKREDVWNILDEVAKLLLKSRNFDGQTLLSRLAENLPKIGSEQWTKLDSFKQVLNNNESIF